MKWPLFLCPLALAAAPPSDGGDHWREIERPALLHRFEQNLYGVTPPGLEKATRWVVRESRNDALGGIATRRRIGVLFEGREDGRQMELLLYLPNAAEGPVPVFLGLNFDGNFATTTDPDLPLPHHWVAGLGQKLPDHRATEAMRGHLAGMFPYEAILQRGYGVATAAYGEIEPDAPEQFWHGPRVLAPPTQSHSWGAIGAWAWGLSRALDYLLSDDQVDPHRVAVFGFSRLGKTAMWAGAQDERFAAVISQNSGKAGVSLMNRGQGEPAAHLIDSFGYWFAPQFASFAEHEDQLPVGGGELASLIAPRPLLILSASEDSWSDPEGEFLGGKAATPIYQRLGVEGLAAETFPAAQKLIPSRIGYYLRPGRHNVTPEDWQATLDWADLHLKP
ncbi:hypothetical protein HNR46_003315 [Haloferula luteola]|uniref:4-O-methyl-glucuronoyl methylesterase-like domain-containing protein n=1 Tax=Haloferula luteola TaxID=595692 RepID=A0A840V516_9BACT|nr:acetylxylan esterase [Haloferula luteola]MBB5353062.1 hypothetical protein [Haloferula luteola]